MFLTLAFLFSSGAMLGWVLEVFYRRFISSANPDRRWINPGFCTGPYLPLYGCGLCILYLLASLERYNIIVSPFWNRAVLFLVMAVCMTAIEYAAGMMSLKVAKIRLWDYRDRWGNVQGVICPAFSLAWAALGAAYYFGVHPYVLDALAWLSRNLAFSFVIGMFYGVFLIDLVHSAQLVSKMKAFADEHQIIVRYEDVKMHIREVRERAGKRVYFLFAFTMDISLGELLKDAKNAWEARR